MSLVTTTATMLASAPAYGTGTLCGAGDWRLVVEQLVGTGPTWGAPTQWGAPTEWGTLTWHDVTPYVRGIDWFRGADEPNGRPRVGNINLDFFNELDRFDPWVDYPSTRPGSVIRAGLISITDSRSFGWLPLWCGIVEDWPVQHVGSREGYRADSFARVVLNETLGELAQIYDNGISLGHAGETVYERIRVLLDESRWRYGYTYLFGSILGEPMAVMQATDLSENRIVELYQTADSAVAIIRSDVTGYLLLTTKDPLRDTRLASFSWAPGTGYPQIVLGPVDAMTGSLRTIAYDVDSVASANNRSGIFNDMRFTRVGGAQQLVEHSVSIGRFGRKTLERSDLICTTDADALAAATAAANDFARTALRVENVTVTATNRDEELLCCAAVDIHDIVTFVPPGSDGWEGTGRIRSVSHQVVPLSRDAVQWTTSFAIDFHDITGVTGAMLDEI